MGGKSAPAPPDYSGIAQASEEQSRLQADLAQQQLDWAKEQWADQSELLSRVVASAEEQQDWARQTRDWQQGLSEQDRARYEALYQPVEEAYRQRALEYDEKGEAFPEFEGRPEFERPDPWATAERRARAAAQAQTDIRSQFDAQRANALQRLESYGVDPSETRSAALDLGARIEEAKAMAQGAQGARSRIDAEGMARDQQNYNWAAQDYARELEGRTQDYNRALQERGLNQAREQVGIGLLGSAVNQGRGLPTQGLQYSGQALQAGNQALGANQQVAGAAPAWQGAAGAMGTPTQWMAGSDRSLGTYGNALTGGYNAQLGAYNAEQANNPWNQLMGAAGTGLGMWAGRGFPFAEGGEVDGPGGPKDDAIPARLSDGEFVIPADVVKRKGTEFFDKLVEKTKEEDRQRGANAAVARHAFALPV